MKRIIISGPQTNAAVSAGSRPAGRISVVHHADLAGPAGVRPVDRDADLHARRSRHPSQLVGVEQVLGGAGADEHARPAGSGAGRRARPDDRTQRREADAARDDHQVRSAGAGTRQPAPNGPRMSQHWPLHFPLISQTFFYHGKKFCNHRRGCMCPVCCTKSIIYIYISKLT